MSPNRLLRTGFAVLAIGVLLSPYATPVACGVANHGPAHTTHAADGADVAVTVPGDGHATCHDAMGCVAHATAVIARVGELRVGPAHVEAPPLPPGSETAIAPSPLTPPPRA